MASHVPSVAEMVEALCLFDEPMLNSRYHALLLRRGEEPAGSGLGRLPGLALQCERLAREGALAWEQRTARTAQTAAFVEWAEYTVMESFLLLSESQLRIAAHMARSAPDEATRRPFDQMCERHREISLALRHSLKRLARPDAEEHQYRRSVQEEESDGDFRGQLEIALAATRTSGAGARHIVLSPTGLRHLRDQGCFREGRSDFAGIPVSVDLGWDAPAFVVETFDRVGLDEILHVEESARAPAPPGSRDIAGLPR